MGFSRQQINQANDVICGRGTIEAAPALKPEHLPVFDCANKCGRHGVRFIHVDGHIRMMAAAQPFISGAISKTINLPAEATVDDIQKAYFLSWQLGLKANALYRDGSKLSQPLNVKSDEEADQAQEDDQENVNAAKDELAKDTAAAVVSATTDYGRLTTDKGAAFRSDNIVPAPMQTVEKIIERIVERPLRRRLPDTRNAKTHKFDVAGHEGYITVGLYDDGSPGEVFITMAKEGSTIGGLMDTIATLISVSLQYGVPVESLVRKFEHVRFEPSGMTRNPEIPIAKSLIDYIFRWLAMEFVPGYKAANAPKRTQPAAASPSPGTLGEGRGQGQSPAPQTPASALSTQHSAPAPTLPTLERPKPPEAAPRRGGNGNGNGHGKQDHAHSATQHSAPSTQDSGLTLELHAKVETTTTGTNLRLVVADPVSQQGTEMQADAPACDVCGAITVRSGTCYKCLNCGNSMGCS
jgi:ribonucleoside-diphosphate reductase alpha chain